MIEKSLVLSETRQHNCQSWQVSDGLLINEPGVTLLGGLTQPVMFHFFPQGTAT